MESDSFFFVVIVLYLVKDKPLVFWSDVIFFLGEEYKISICPSPLSLAFDLIIR